LRLLPAVASSPVRRSSTVVALTLAVSLLGATRARALDIELGAPHIRSDSVWIDVHLTDPVSARIEESLLRGMPATLQLRAELWHRRRAWFDRLEENVDAELRIRYEVYNRTFRIERRGAPTLRVGTVDSLRLALARPFSLLAGRLRPESRTAAHFIVVTAILRPLSVEDVAEVESWLSGEVETKRRSGFGLITQVPQALFDAVRNFAGFGDARARAMSGDFTVESDER